MTCERSPEWCRRKRESTPIGGRRITRKYSGKQQNRDFDAGMLIAARVSLTSVPGMRGEALRPHATSERSAPGLERGDEIVKVAEVEKAIVVEVRAWVADLERDDEVVKVAEVEKAVDVKIGRACGNQQ